MKIEHNISLLPYNTFGIDVKARDLVAINNHDDLMELLKSGLLRENRFVIVGGGSNLVFRGDYEGVVVVMCNSVKSIQGTMVEAEAGVVMDDLIRWCVENELYGMENLIAIPGTVGASAVQNVGAYGMEAKDVIEEVCAYEIATGEQRIFKNAECDFGYRWSAFKGELANKYIIEKVKFKLTNTFEPKISYQGIDKALQQAGVASPTAKEMIEIITDVRWNKLPNPKEVGSAGSFFQNPIVDKSQHDGLKVRFPEMVSFVLPDGRFKLAAGWLIEHAGWKGKVLNHAGVWKKQALVLVNADGKASGEDVVALAKAITDDIENQYGVKLEREAIYV